MDKKFLIGSAVLILVLAGAYFMLPGKDAVENSSMLGGNQAREVAISEPVYFENVQGYFARPEAPGDYPGVVMVHEWWGLNDNIKEIARNLAAEGYQVLAVDLYRGEVAATADRARELRTSAPQEEMTANLRAAAAYLRGRGAARIASLGWCFGGGQSLQLALSGENLDATVIYYGNLVTDEAELGALNWPVLGIFGAEDASIPVATVEEFDRALDRAGIANEIHVYPGVGHAFANPSGMNYAPEETRDAWAKTLAFLGEHLR